MVVQYFLSVRQLRILYLMSRYYRLCVRLHVARIWCRMARGVDIPDAAARAVMFYALQLALLIYDAVQVRQLF